MNKIETIEISRDGDGNTRNITVKQDIQRIFWCFTLNNYSIDDIEILETVFKSLCKWYIFQEEIGEEGTPHLQGTLSLLQKSRLTELKHINPKIHWEPTKSVKSSIAYCQKTETRRAHSKVYTFNIEIPKEINVEEPRGWQLQVIQIINTKPDCRSIHWFWEPNGNVGKSTLCKYLVVKHKALILTGKSSDMFHQILKCKDDPKLIICDIPRQSLEYINYGAIEQIKNGLIFSGKYEGGQRVFDPPHVICFANEPPKMSAMSLDRWKVTEITIQKLYFTEKVNDLVYDSESDYIDSD